MAKCKECSNSFGMMELKNGVCKTCQKKKTPPCSSCGKLFSPEELNTESLCAPCATKKEEARQARKKEQIQDAEFQSIILTTESCHNMVIEKRIGVITAEAVIGTHLIKDIFASVRDVVGGAAECYRKHYVKLGK